MNATFTQAGVSRLKGEFKARFANDALRVKVLAKNGHTDIDLMELPTPMTKEAAVAFLLSVNFDNGHAEVRAALESELEKRTEKPAAEKKPRAKKQKAEITMESIKAKIDEANGVSADASGAAADDAVADDAAESATEDTRSVEELDDAPY